MENANNQSSNEGRTFSDKRRFFEKEIREQNEPKAQSSIATEMAGDQDYDKVLARMKSLEADAVRAQAVIARAQEMSKDATTTSSSTLSTVDIAFADDEEADHTVGQNGEHASQVEVTKQQIYEVNLNKSPVSRYNNTGSTR